jgi:hypothetical protein
MANIKISDETYEGVLRISTDDAENETRNVFTYDGQTSGVYPCSLMDGDVTTSLAHVTVTNGNHVVIVPSYTGDIRVEILNINTKSITNSMSNRTLTMRSNAFAKLKTGDVTKTVIRYSDDTVCAEAYLVSQSVNAAMEAGGFIDEKMVPNTKKTYTNVKEHDRNIDLGSIVFAAKVTNGNKIEFDLEWYVNDVRYI